MKTDEILIKTFDQVKNDNFDQVKFDQVIVCLSQHTAKIKLVCFFRSRKIPIFVTVLFCGYLKWHQFFTFFES